MRIGFRFRRRGRLDPILIAKRAEAARMLAGPRHLAAWEPEPGVLDALRREPHAPPRWIARFSPALVSANEVESVSLNERAATPEAFALDAASKGAHAVWISTDELFAGGSYAALSRARAALTTSLGSRRPRLVSEDVIVDAVQIDRAAGAGADAVLLIAKATKPSSLEALITAVKRRGLDPIVEVAADDELERAVAAGAQLIAVHTRDRDTGKLNLERPRSLLASIRRRDASLLAIALVASDSEAGSTPTDLPADALATPEPT